jgi:hypothetical protein
MCWEELGLLPVNQNKIRNLTFFRGCLSAALLIKLFTRNLAMIPDVFDIWLSKEPPTIIPVG